MSRRPDPWAAGNQLLLRHPLPTGKGDVVVAAGRRVESLGPHPNDTAEICINVPNHGQFCVPFWWLTIPPPRGPLRISKPLLGEIWLNTPQHIADQLTNHFGAATLDYCVTQRPRPNRSSG